MPPGPGDAARALVPGPEVVSRVLIARGQTTPQGAAAFLDPKLTQLHDPSLIPDLDIAAERILRALKDREPVVIYGDYDVDGVTATSVLYHTCKAIEPDADVRTYVPHRLEEGYGLNAEAMVELAQQGAKVIVSVDCGVTAVGPALAAREAGVDLVITDHHNPPVRVEDLPRAFAVVHPRRPDSRYPFGELSGAGVAYKLAWRLATLSCGGPGAKTTPKLREMLVELLAFAALGTIADIVPLVGENRILARYGLVRAKNSPFIGLRALVEAAGLSGEDLDAMAVGFRLGPRLNAAGRMGHARDAVELFTTAGPERARELAKMLSEQNDARRGVERAIFDQACAMAEKAGMTGSEQRAIVLAHPQWHPGVVGIVCSRMVERYHRPTILMQMHDGVCHGSGRSVDGFNLHAGLVHCAEQLDRYGGHNMAAGVHLVEPKLHAFTDRFTAYANSMIAAELLSAHVTVDCEATPSELHPQAVQELHKLGPFGAGNPEPKLLVRNLTIAGKQSMGAEAKHATLQLRAMPETGTAPTTQGYGLVWRCVAWGWGEHLDKLPIGAKIDAVIKPRISRFNGNERVEPEVCDVRVVT